MMMMRRAGGVAVLSARRSTAPCWNGGIIDVCWASTAVQSTITSSSSAAASAPGPAGLAAAAAVGKVGGASPSSAAAAAAAAAADSTRVQHRRTAPPTTPTRGGTPFTFKAAGWLAATDLDGAMYVFDRCTGPGAAGTAGPLEPDTVRILMAALAAANRAQDAARVWQTALAAKVTLPPHVLQSLLSECYSLAALSIIESPLLARASRPNWDTLALFFARRSELGDVEGSFRRFMKAVETMGKPSNRVLAVGTLIACRAGHTPTALKMFRTLCRGDGVFNASPVLRALLQHMSAAKDADIGAIIDTWREFESCGGVTDPVTASALVACLSQRGPEVAMRTAIELASRGIQLSPTSWKLLARSVGIGSDASICGDFMRFVAGSAGVSVDPGTLAECIFAECERASDIEYLCHVSVHAVSTSGKPMATAWAIISAAIAQLARLGRPSTGISLFRRAMDARFGTPSSSALFATTLAACQLNQPPQATQLFLWGCDLAPPLPPSSVLRTLVSCLAATPYAGRAAQQKAATRINNIVNTYMRAGGLLDASTTAKVATSIAQLDPPQAFTFLRQAVAIGTPVHPNIPAALIRACANRRDVETALQLKAFLTTVGVQFDAQAYAGLIATYGRAGKAAEALQCLKDMQAAGLPVDIGAVTAAVEACIAASAPELGWTAVKEMKAHGIAPNAAMYAALMKLCSASGVPLRGVQVFGDMLDAGIPADIRTCRLLMSGVKEILSPTDLASFEAVLQAIMSKHPHVGDVMRAAGEMPDRPVQTQTFAVTLAAGKAGLSVSQLLQWRFPSDDEPTEAAEPAAPSVSAPEQDDLKFDVKALVAELRHVPPDEEVPGAPEWMQYDAPVRTTFEEMQALTQAPSSMASLITTPAQDPATL